MLTETSKTVIQVIWWPGLQGQSEKELLFQEQDKKEDYGLQMHLRTAE